MVDETKGGADILQSNLHRLLAYKSTVSMSMMLTAHTSCMMYPSKTGSVSKSSSFHMHYVYSIMTDDVDRQETERIRFYRCPRCIHEMDSMSVTPPSRPVIPKAVQVHTCSVAETCYRSRGFPAVSPVQPGTSRMMDISVIAIFEIHR